MISVIIPTHNRAALLEEALISLAAQTLPREQYEVIVVDDGSTDATRDVCGRFSSQMTLKYFFIENSGISAAKNLGIYASQYPLLLFFDDDDVADRHLLREHLKTHAQHPSESVAVLGFTGWAPWLEVTELMRFVTDIGCFLFSYGNLKHGQTLDFTYFWGGRSSCKKSLLIRTGVFRQEFEFGSEDIELGFRISKRLLQGALHRSGTLKRPDDPPARLPSTNGVAVVFNRRAIQHMIRPLTYEQFCRRCERQGRSQWQFSRFHQDAVVHQWCGVLNASERWSHTGPALSAKVAAVIEMERTIDDLPESAARRRLLTDLHDLYRWTFHAYKLKGIIDAMALDPPSIHDGALESPAYVRGCAHARVQHGIS